jgi:hypothetical protein
LAGIEAKEFRQEYALYFVAAAMRFRLRVARGDAQ